MLPYHPFDQELQVDKFELDYIDDLFEKSVRDLDVENLFDYMIETQKQFQMKGMALAKLCYLMSENWNIFQIGDNFLDTAADRTGLHRHTIERYVKVWQMIKNAPKQIAPELQQKSIGTLIPVANAVAQGVEFEDATWDRIVDAPDRNSVSKIINEEMGREERSNRLNIWLDRTGSLWAQTKDDRKFVGSLEIADDNDIVQSAIERICRSAGVLKS